MTLDDVQRVAGALSTLDAAAAKCRRDRKIDTYFPDCLPTCDPESGDKEDHVNPDGSQRCCRILYYKHLLHFDGGAHHRERCLMAGNRVGKSDAGAYESTLHLTGLYPHWWEGRRFDCPTKGWACGKTAGKVKNITQAKLMGPIGSFGAGFIPADRIHRYTMKRGEPDAVGTVWVRHVSGGLSVCQFKSFEEKRKGFEGTEQHFIWLDEEPPMAVYTECVVRTMQTSDFGGGCVYATFTPLDGMTELIQLFMPHGSIPEDGVVPDELP